MIASEEQDEERIAIREELSTMSFEQLQKLKEEMGTKLFNKKVFTKARLESVNDSPKMKTFKRENKNRPREISSKVPVRRKQIKESVISVPKNIPRDPRFDNLCGTFKEKAFHSAYRFVDDMREKELNDLKKKLKKEKNPEEQTKIKYLIQRMGNQCREAAKKREKEEQEKEERLEKIQALKRGEKPTFKKKSEKTMINLVEKYETLKKSGKITKHIEKKTKLLKAKDRKNSRYFNLP